MVEVNCILKKKMNPEEKTQKFEEAPKSQILINKSAMADLVYEDVDEHKEISALSAPHVCFAHDCEISRRSFVRLELGNYTGALEDAKEALALAPKYSEAYIAQGDAFLALNQFDSAEQSYLASLDIDPSIRHSKSFKARITKLQEKLAAANTS